MWSLPDINRMNASAAKEQPELQDQIDHPEKHTCDACDERAVVGLPYYDIFSDDIKGVDLRCEDHEYDEDDSVFECPTCERRMVDHYTWERYQTPQGECLSCAAKAHFADPDNWVDPKIVDRIVMEGASPLVRWWDEKAFRINLDRVPHVLGVKQPIPAGIEFVENFEFDGTSGRQISGGDMLEAIKQLDRPFTLVMDAAYQFAVSIGIYQRKLTDGEKVAATVAAAGLGVTTRGRS